MPAELGRPPAFGHPQIEAPNLFEAARSMVRAGASLPFDALRLGYAGAVQAGLVRRSILASRDVEMQLDALERLVLGPFARGA
jgi:hypothetical protein